MYIRRLHHIAVICTDQVLSKRFYVDVLGLSVLAENVDTRRGNRKLDLASPCGAQIELFDFANAPARLSYPEARGLRHLAFGVDDIDAMRRHLVSHGVPTQEIRLDQYTGRHFFFASDPDALPIEFYQVDGRGVVD